MQEGDVIKLNKLDAVQHFTQPPGRYTEASLIKNLEKEGIGRPSTYAAIIETLRLKEYVEIENRTLTPTGKGASACAFLDKNFNDFIKLSKGCNNSKIISEEIYQNLTSKRASNINLDFSK